MTETETAAPPRDRYFDEAVFVFERVKLLLVGLAVQLRKDAAVVPRSELIEEITQRAEEVDDGLGLLGVLTFETPIQREPEGKLVALYWCSACGKHTMQEFEAPDRMYVKCYLCGYEATQRG